MLFDAFTAGETSFMESIVVFRSALRKFTELCVRSNSCTLETQTGFRHYFMNYTEKSFKVQII